VALDCKRRTFAVKRLSAIAFRSGEKDKNRAGPLKLKSHNGFR
jgi:hypothetical protein